MITELLVDVHVDGASLVTACYRQVITRETSINSHLVLSIFITYIHVSINTYIHVSIKNYE